MIDTHCHLDIEVFDADRSLPGRRPPACSVPAIRPRTWPAFVAAAWPHVRIALGIHPQVVPDLTPEEVEAEKHGMDCSVRTGVWAVYSEETPMASVAVKLLVGLPLPRSCDARRRQGLRPVRRVMPRLSC